MNTDTQQKPTPLHPLNGGSRLDGPMFPDDKPFRSAILAEIHKGREAIKEAGGVCTCGDGAAWHLDGGRGRCFASHYPAPLPCHCERFTRAEVSP